MTIWRGEGGGGDATTDSEINFITSLTNSIVDNTAITTAAADATAALYDSFDDRYLGSKTAAPTLDNDSNALIPGALYWNSVSNQMFVWSGTAWQQTFFSGTNVRSVVTATAGQTVVTTPSYTQGNNTIQVYVNGFKVISGTDYTETSTTSITFTSGLTLSDEVEIIIAQPFSVGITSSDAVNYLPSGTGAVATTVQTKLRESVSVKDFGAVGDGVTDDTSAIQAAITYTLSSGKRGNVFMPTGTYRTTSTLFVDGVSCGLVGQGGGELSTILYVDHVNGPGIQLKNRRNSLCNIEVTGSPTRAAGAAGTNYGVLIEADDIAGRYPTHCRIENVYIQDHPSHGLVAVAGVFFSSFSNMTIRDNKGHGMVFDNGTISTRTNTANPGIVELDRLEIFDNDGHGILIGNDNASTNRGFRFDIRNIDLYRNAQAAGIRKQASQMWMFADTSSITISAFDGRNKAETSVVTQGIWLHGRNLTVDRCRFLNVNTTAVTVGGAIVGFITVDIRITGNSVFDGDGTNPSLNPAVAVDATAVNVFADWPNGNEIAGPKTLTNNATPITRSMVLYKLSDQIVNNSTVEVDDTDLQFSIGTNQRAAFRFVIFYVGDATADIKVQILGPSGSTTTTAPTAGIRITGGDTVVQQDATVSFGTFVYGASATTRVIELVGTITTAATSGTLRLKFAQAVATVADTTVKAGSYLMVQV